MSECIRYRLFVLRWAFSTRGSRDRFLKRGLANQVERMATAQRLYAEKGSAE